MAEITSIREINVKKETIKIEFTYFAQYNKQKTYFNNLDFTKVAMKFFEINEAVDNIKFIDKYGYFKVYRKEFENKY